MKRKRWRFGIQHVLRCRVGFRVRGWKCGADGMCVDHGNKLRKSSEISHVSRRVRS